MTSPLPHNTNTITDEHDKRVNDQISGQTSGPLSQQFGKRTTIATGGGDVAERDIDKPQGDVFVEHSTIYGDVVGQQHNSYQGASAPRIPTRPALLLPRARCAP
jgi:hypothetical protein